MNCKTPQKLNIQRYHAGELSGTYKVEFKGHLDSCACCREYLESLESDKGVFLFKHSYDTIKTKKDTAGHSENFTLPKIWKPALVPVFLLMISFVIFVPRLFENVSENKKTQRGEIIFKSGTRIELLLNRKGNVTPWTNSHVYQPGDELQVLYTLTDLRLSAIQLFSIDSKGEVTLFNTRKEDSSISWKAVAGEKTPLPLSLTLDDTPGYELIVVLFSEKALEPKIWKKEFENMYRLSAGDGDKLKHMISKKYSGKAGLAKTILVPK